MLAWFFAHPVLIFLLLCITPFLGMKVALPVGILIFGFDPFGRWTAVGMLITIFWGLFLYLILDYWMLLAEKTPVFKKIFKAWDRRVKTRARQYVTSYGIFSLAFLLALPFPHYDVYTGSVFSHFLGYRFKDYAIGVVLGVVFSGLVIAMLAWILRAALL